MILGLFTLIFTLLFATTSKIETPNDTELIRVQNPVVVESVQRVNPVECRYSDAPIKMKSLTDNEIVSEQSLQPTQKNDAEDQSQWEPSTEQTSDIKLKDAPAHHE